MTAFSPWYMFVKAACSNLRDEGMRIDDLERSFIVLIQLEFRTTLLIQESSLSSCFSHLQRSSECLRVGEACTGRQDLRRSNCLIPAQTFIRNHKPLKRQLSANRCCETACQIMQFIMGSQKLHRLQFADLMPFWNQMAAALRWASKDFDFEVENPGPDFEVL